MKRALIQWLSVLSVVIWMCVVIVGYYIVHKPFDAEQIIRILSNVGDVIVAVLIYALAASLGRRVLRGFTFVSPLECLVFCTGVGLGILSFATFLLGLTGAQNGLLFWAIVLSAFLLLRNEGLETWRDLRAIRLVGDSRFETVLKIFILVTLILAGLVCLTPPLAWDAQLYHLFMGKLALAQGRLTPPPDILSMNYPSLIEMVYLMAMTLKGDGGTGLIHIGYLVLLLGALFAFSERFISRKVGWFAGTLLLAVPSFLLVSTWQYNDTALTFYTFGAFYALWLAKENLNERWFVLVGAFAGMSLGMKYTAFTIPLALMVLMWLARKRLELKHWLLFLGACGLTASPWYLRNWIWMGNPVYPFIFGGKFWDSFRAHWYNLAGSGLINEPLRLLFVPWEATILGQEGKTSFEATIGPLFLVLLPLLFLLWRRIDETTPKRELLVFSTVLYVFWLAGVALSRGLEQSRLLFPAFPTMALLAALGFDALPILDVSRFSLARFTRLGVVLVLGLTLLAQTLAWVSLNPLPYLAGIETREQYLSTRLTPGYWDVLQFTNRLPQAKVIFFWEPRAYYASNPLAVQPDEVLDTFPSLQNQYHDAAGIARALRAQGYTHILLCRWGLDFALAEKYVGLSLDDGRVLQDLTSRYARQVYGSQPLDYWVDENGMARVQNVDQEPYAVYQILDPSATRP